MNETISIKDGKLEDGTDRFLEVRITTMSAYKAEQWLYRAILALGKGFDGSLNDIRKNHEVLLSAIASLDYQVAKPLLDELLACCEVINGNQTIRLSESTCGIIQSPITLMKLRLESAKRNFAFFQDGGVLNSLFGEPTE